jgi:DNA-binding NarL/FixJ family response regulator
MRRAYETHPAPVRRAVVADYRAGLSLTDLGGRYGIAQATMNRWVKEAGAARTRSEGNRLKAVPWRRAQVAELVAEGLTTRQISERLGIKVKHVKQQKARLRRMQ